MPRDRGKKDDQSSKQHCRQGPWGPAIRLGDTAGSQGAQPPAVSCGWQSQEHVAETEV